MPRLAEIEISEEQLNFAAGHFTVFSKTHREKLHGHNYQVSCALTMHVPELGIMFDYRIYKKKILDLCQTLNQTFLLPKHCPYLSLEENDAQIIAHFNGEKIPFLKTDVILLPVSNVTVEELSQYFLQCLLEDKEDIKDHALQQIIVKVSNSPGVSGSARWHVDQKGAHL